MKYIRFAARSGALLETYGASIAIDPVLWKAEMNYAMNFLTLSKTLALLVAVTALATPLAAQAAVPGESQLKGTVTAYDGKYDLHVQTASGDVDAVTLHQGTIINPTGLSLRPGMEVTVLGNNAAGVFAANEIDTPYHVRDLGPDVYPYSAFGGPFYGGPFFGGAFYGGPFFGFGF